MVVSKVVSPKPAQMIFVQRDDMVEQFVPRAAHPALRHAVLPRTTNARAHWFESTGLQELQHLVPELGIMLEQDTDKGMAAGMPPVVVVRSSRLLDGR
jgi:hypothetical protein